METYGEHGKIHISKETYNFIKDKYSCEDRGEIDIKGIGPLHTYFLSDSIS